MIKKSFSLIIIISFLTLYGCTNQEPLIEDGQPNDITITIEEPLLTMDELAKHNSEKDCWLLINGNIYDVTEYIPSHPGKAILDGCGKEATELFTISPHPHSETATNMLEGYLLGPLNN